MMYARVNIEQMKLQNKILQDYKVPLLSGKESSFCCQNNKIGLEPLPTLPREVSELFQGLISDLPLADTITGLRSPPWELKNLDRRLSSAYLSLIENVFRRENTFVTQFETLGSYE
ncbi:hypothetical protein BB560_004319, partial [Smittium megazygosporum]